MSQRIRGELFETLEGAEQLREGWDALAVHLGLPYCSPAWMLSWWRHLAPDGAQLRVAAAIAAGRVVAVAPLFLQRGPFGLRTYRLLAAGISSPLDVLVDAEFADGAGAALLETLHTRDGRIDAVLFEGIPEDSPTPQLFARRWPAPSEFSVHRQYAQEAPYFEHQGRTFDGWFAARGWRFRRNMRQGQRQLERAGGISRIGSNEGDVANDLSAFARLHRARWRSRGGAGALPNGSDQMLVEAAGQLGTAGRLRVSTVRTGKSIVGAFVLLSAGGRTSVWLGGLDPEEQRVKQPAMLAALCAVEHSFSAGDREFDWGAGTQWYKSQFTEAVRHQVWTIVVRRGWRAPLARGLMLRSRVLHRVAEMLSPKQKRVLRGIRAKLSGGVRPPG